MKKSQHLQSKYLKYSLPPLKKSKRTQAIISAVGLSITASATLAEQVTYLDQGWDAVNHFREISYNLSQGSQLLPYDLFLTLESYDSTQLVSSDNNIRSWGYLPAADDYDAQINPDRLPVGFAKDIDAQDGNEYIGLTCAACHTGQIKHSGKELRIDGGQSLSDMVGFLKHLALSVEATINSQAKFKRLVARLGIEKTPENLNHLKDRLTASLNTLNREVKNTGTANNSAIGRLDAFGSIGNTILEHDMALPNNFRAPKAPVSFPYLWQTSNLERTQYTGIAENNFSRNVGEIIGVFSEVNLNDPTQLFHHNIKGHNLFALENMVRALKAPKWPEEILGGIDQAAATRGYTVYNTVDYSGKSCAGCHTLPDAQGNYPMTPAADNLYGKQFIKTYNIPLSDIGTDSTAANLLFQPFMAETGALSFLFGGAAFYPSIVIERTVFGAMTKRLFAEMQLTPTEQVVYSGFRFYAPGKEPAPDVAAYRARPLPGIWATGPFLHNGSVRTLTELLKPSPQRETQFYVGSRHFDPTHVGYRSIPSQDGHQKTEVVNTTVVGNSNVGHEYGVYFTEQEKRDLVEFLKTL